MTTKNETVLFDIKGQSLSAHAITTISSDPVFNKLSDGVRELLIQVPRVYVDSEESYSKAGDLLKLLKTRTKKLEQLRVQWTRPVNQAIKAVNKHFKETVTDGASAAEREVKAKMAAWFRQEQERRDKEAEAAARDAEAQAIETAQKVNDERAADAILEQGSEIADAERAAAKVGPVRGDLGSTSSARRVKKWRVSNAAKVPREFLMVNDREVNVAMKQDREIPGIEYYYDVQVAIL